MVHASAGPAIPPPEPALHSVGDDSWLVDEGLELLDPAECRRLATTQPVGRVAVSIGEVPAVFPVNFCVHDGDVFFRTATGTKLAAASRNAVVAFEVDHFDTLNHAGWSVLIVGTASEVPAEVAETIEPLRVRAWAPGERCHLVRVRADFISGRRIVHNER
jgi:nitroimidazol reductase NimA-like FMN-containing flavoprotein (pyridoxamine 5'-phosphate oxidase superfamily)